VGDAPIEYLAIVRSDDHHLPFGRRCDGCSPALMQSGV